MSLGHFQIGCGGPGDFENWDILLDLTTSQCRTVKSPNVRGEGGILKKANVPGTLILNDPLESTTAFRARS